VNESGPVIEFETSEHNYGTIPYKGDGTYDFVFKNTGKEPLLLKNVRSSCGCTVRKSISASVSVSKFFLSIIE
jgi:hypothetical protein